MKSKNWSIGVYSFIISSILLSSACKSKNTINSTQNLMDYNSYVAQLKQIRLHNGYVIKYFDNQLTDAKKTILMVHGVPTSSWMYRKVAKLYRQKGYRVIVPDMLGYGPSDMPKGYDIYAPKQMGKYLLELMDSLKIDNWEQMCHDAGGLWTWEMLKLDRSKVNQLILLNTIIFKEGFNPPMQMRKNFITKAYVKTYTANLFRKGMMQATLNNGLHNKEVCDPKMLAGYTNPTKNRLDRALFYFFSNVCVKELPDYSELLSSLSMPKKIIWGMEDKILQITPQKDKLNKCLKIGNDDILELKDAKHFIAEEKANEIVQFATK